MTVIERKCCLVVGHQLVEVLVDLGQLGRELLVIEDVAFLVEELGHRDDQHQPLLGLHLGEADRLEGGELLGEARGLLSSQVPENETSKHQCPWCPRNNLSLTWQRQGAAPGVWQKTIFFYISFLQTVAFSQSFNLYFLEAVIFK